MSRPQWEAELRSLVRVNEQTGCWIYQGYIDTTGNGYGKWRGPGWDVGGWAHRNAWFIHHGPIPDHLEIDHLCYRPACVNVDHLELVTPAENKRRAAARRESYRKAAPVEHGTAASYARGCDCRPCTAARSGKLFDTGSRIAIEPVDAPLIHELTVLSVYAPPAWMARGACVGYEVDLWTKGTVGCHQLAEAAAVCETCPVFDDCFDYAAETRPAFGVWAGIRADEWTHDRRQVAA